MTSITKKHRLPRLGFPWRRTLAEAAAILLLPAIFLGASRLDAAAPTCVPAVATAGTVTPSSSSSPPAAAFTPSKFKRPTASTRSAWARPPATASVRPSPSSTPTTIPISSATRTAFSSQFGLQQFNVSGGPTLSVLSEKRTTNTLPGSTAAPWSGWSIEESLDVEWAHAVAPKANIILYEAKSARRFSDMLTTVLNGRRPSRRLGGVDELGHRRILRRESWTFTSPRRPGTPRSPSWPRRATAARRANIRPIRPTSSPSAAPP